MNFALSEEQTAIADMARAFGAEHIAPFARKWEIDGTIPRHLWKSAAALGLGGIFVPEDQGGAGLDRLTGTLVFQELARACPSVAAFLSIHNMVAALVAARGSDQLKSTLLERAVSMDAFLAYCLTEPGCGSDAAALATRADDTDGGWRLNGTKSFISGGGYADAYLVMARSDGAGPGGISAFLVEDGTPGLSFGGLEDKMGWKAQPTRQVHLDNCDIPPENLVGSRGMGFKYAMAALDGGRLNIAACSLGAAEAALEQTTTYLSDRKAFGKPLSNFQALRFQLADARIELAAASDLLRHAAWSFDLNQPDATTRIAMAKSFATEAACRAVDTCLQLHGGYGYLADHGIEKLARDLRVHRILEGTNEIMRVIIARDMLDKT